MKILHIIRNPNDITPLEIAKAQGVEHDVALLLLHDAVYMKPGLKALLAETMLRQEGLMSTNVWGMTG